MNALKKSLDVFKLQTEHVSLAHLQLAQSMRGEVKKLEEFREKQKEMKKKMEQNMDAFHKLKSSQFKKTMEVHKRCLNVKGKRLVITSTAAPRSKVISLIS
eukprot:XP_011615469.1 PREDICTED: proline-serine-threonine phosphatase-interacting protein 2-like [Takifugu rubripes]